MKKELSLITCMAAAMAANGVYAANQSPALEEIVVTTKKREEKLTEVPISVLAVSGQDIENNQIVNLTALSEQTPNFKLVQTGLIPNIYMRGVGSGSNQGFDMSVGMFIDGIYYARATHAVAGFADIERVEVLRGPQSTYFGKNTIAGAVNVITARPTQEFEGKVSGGYSTSHKDTRSSVMLSGPLTDSFRARAVVRNRTSEGFLDNIKQDRKEPGIDESLGRLTFDLDVTESLSALLKLERFKRVQDGRNLQIISGGSMSNCTGENVEKDYKSSTSVRAHQTLEGDNITFVLNQIFENDFSVTYQAGYVSTDYFDWGDGDIGESQNIDLLGTELFEQESHELRFASPAGQFLVMSGGVYYQTSSIDFDENAMVTLRGGHLAELNACVANQMEITKADMVRDYQVDTEVYSAYVDFTLNLLPWMSADIGFRYIDESKDGYRKFDLYDHGTQNAVNPALAAILEQIDINAHELDGYRQSKILLPSYTVRFEPYDELMIYASYKEGAKSGGYDARNNNGNDGAGGGGTNFEFNDELAESLEAGFKARLGNRAEINFAVFETMYEDMQVSVFDGNLGFIVNNAGEALINGVEFDYRYAATNNLTFSGGVAYLNFKWEKYENGPCYYGGEDGANANGDGSCNLEGKDNANTPQWTGSLNTDYRRPIGDLALVASMTVNFSDEHYTYGDLDPRSHQDAYYKINARIGLVGPDEKWTISLLGQNLTNEEVLVFSSPTALDRGSYEGSMARDRTIWLRGAYSF